MGLTVSDTSPSYIDSAACLPAGTGLRLIAGGSYRAFCGSSMAGGMAGAALSPFNAWRNNPFRGGLFNHSDYSGVATMDDCTSRY